jgi:hypothetical protein
MGKMNHKGATENVRKSEMKKGSLALQLGTDQGEQINTGSVDEAIEDTKKQVLSEKETRKSENQELLKKIDIGKMFS